MNTKTVSGVAAKGSYSLLQFDKNAQTDAYEYASIPANA